MKKKVLCVVLALLMCTMVSLPTFADGEADTPEQNRTALVVYAGLTHVSGSMYDMWAEVFNPAEESVHINLQLFNGSYIRLISIGTTSTEILFGITREVSLLPGTYHLRVTYSGATVSDAFEKHYYI